ncbi:MAG TPA: phosphatidate cytidylyltransferase [Thermoanaerobaculia bacterium]|nr:phosphatidate cytidylyltransferase [Thermoanaerobaculia bacterium]
MPEAGKKSFTRELTTLAAAPLMIWLIGWAPSYAYIAVVFLITGLALYEFLILGARKGYPVQKTLSLALLFLLLTAFLVDGVSVETAVIAVLLIVPAAYVFARSELDEALPAGAVCVLGILYVGMLGGTLLRLRLDFDAGAKLLFFLLIVVWIGDAGAYYVGRQFGRRQLSPRISPKKTIEGAAGGVCTSVAAAIAIHFTFFPELPLLHAFIVAVLLAATGMIGDLAESMWKRSADVKDSGALIPGHGGFLDRFDSILFTAPILYAYWFLLVRDPEAPFL